MTPDRIGQAVMTALLVGVFALVLGAAHLLDEHPYTPAQADAIQHLQAERTREHAARDLCVSEYGPQAAHQWDAQGSLVCITARGEVLRTARL